MSTLDLVVAAHMRPNSDLSARIRKFGLTRGDLQLAKEQAREAGVWDRRASPSDLIAYFGQPMLAEPETLLYHLVLWPDHTFEFGVHEGGWVTHDGFALRRETPLPQRVALTSALGIFQVGWHTTTEVHRVLGPPETLQGWERMEDWFYRFPDQEQQIVLEFDFRLLTGLGSRAPIR